MFEDDPKYRQLKELRESGYDGPVDQDGKPDTDSEAAQILRDLRGK